MKTATRFIIPLVFGTLLAGGAAAAEHPAAPTKAPRDYTCQDLLVTDMAYVPEIVYWHDGWNAKQDVLTEVIDEDWTPVAVDQVWSECEKNPGKTVGEVVGAQRAARHARHQHDKS